MSDLQTVYRISGLIVPLAILLLAVLCLDCRSIWKGRYLFIGAMLCIIAVLEILVAIQVNFDVSTFLASFIYIIIEFSLMILYLGWQLKRPFKVAALFIVFAFISFQVYQAFYAEVYKNFDAIGIYVNTAILLLFSLFNLTMLFKQKFHSDKLRENPDFWFTITIFSLNFMDMVIFVLTDVTYDGKSNESFYLLQISRNLIKIILLYGYYKGIKLLR